MKDEKVESPQNGRILARALAVPVDIAELTTSSFDTLASVSNATWTTPQDEEDA